MLRSMEKTVRLDSSLYFENRTLRSQVLNFAQLRNEEGMTDVTPMIHGIPVATYSLNAGGEVIANEASYFPEHLSQNFWNYKIDFVLKPTFVASFGNFDKPTANKTSLLLNTNIVLPLGLSVYTGINFPLVNQLTSQPRTISPAPTYLSQFLNLGSYRYMSWSAGLFYRDRYGADFQYQKADPSSKYSYGLDVNYSGLYYWYPREFRYTGFKDLSALFNFSVRWYKYNSQLKLTAGRFLYGDNGARLEFVRMYKKADVGFFSVASNHGVTLGLHLAFAIPPGSIAENKYVRLRTSEEFAWDYYYSTGYFIGERFRTNFRLDERLALYHTNYWNQFQR